ncbi:NAD(P)/FAD-dependent oxidoreductase [Microvirga massiliensis]|uniref:NAD(P)/FAD-dependent oxidoreductase n=1 Tax=Microvirga massiliensis TaxID=1033741 RepID=UPI00062BD79A|nr:NAD(P)/FAD-dependent oxidoreductase [Microvirga massiliensis]
MADITKTMLRPRVVIVGGGFGGLTVAQGLANAPVDLTVVDQHNYHLFQPLLYQVATAALSPADIASPIRAILRRQCNTSVMLATVTGIDATRREVVSGERRIPFDYLVLATGAQHAYFGHDGWEAHAKGIKKIDDATFLRRKILLAFERAELETDPEERNRLLTFVVVGGGATGVEIAGAMAELACKALASDFRVIDPAHARIILVEAGPRLLPTFHEHLSKAARHSLEALGVEVRLSTTVTGCDEAGVSSGTGRIEARTVVWGAGVQASRAGEWLQAETDRVGRVKVAPDLSAPGHANIFVIGDTAHVLGMDGKPLPGVAPVAKQEGKYIAKLIRARIAGREHPPFRYRDPGSLATIGRKQAVVQFGRVRLSGYLAWWLWSLVHIYFLIGFRNRLVVAMNWAWTYASFQRGTRLITGPDPETGEKEPSSVMAVLPRGAT